nr:MAG TPA: hypothetical protein [Caudoviricetes sp.]
MEKFEVRKISELTANEAIDVLCEVSVYLANIATDDQLTSELKTKLSGGEMKTKAQQFVFGVEKLTNLVPIILKKHKVDVFGVLVALSTRPITVDEIAHTNIMVVMQNIRKVVQDKDFVDFFKSCVSEETE